MSGANTITGEIEGLNDRFGKPGIVEIAAGQGGLPKVRVNISTADAEIYLHGAQVTSWRPAGTGEVIFLSSRSRWEAGKAIRGGIPICFPWFRSKVDDSKAPAHGFARTRAWRLEGLDIHADSVVITMATESDAVSKTWWPHEFRLVHKITVGAELRLELTVFNTGPTTFSFEEALHTYYRIGSVQKAEVVGLDQVAFLDNRDGNKQKEHIDSLSLSQATDNAYYGTGSPVTVDDPMLKRQLRLHKENSTTTVVWNPWSDGAASLSDLGNEEWDQFICVEAANILGDGITLDAGAQHTMIAVIQVTPQV